ncbi:MAG: glycosyltransferase family 39 protein [Dehalococcoidia bacterium]|nr:glycosyltransferase family 39 protein [Dehalococcoidia bacterium]
MAPGKLVGRRTFALTGQFLVGVVILAMAARLAGLFLVLGYHAPVLSDYEIIATSIRESGYFGFSYFGLPTAPSSFMPPVYPFFLAGMMAISPNDAILATRIVQSVVSSLSILVTFYLARDISKHDGVALIAALLAALYPSFIAGALEVSTVTPEVLLVQLFALSMIRWLRNGRSWVAGCAGLALGLLSLTRVPALLMAPLFLLWMLRAGRHRLRGHLARDMAVFLAAIILIISPWTARNFLVQQAFVPVSTNGGVNFWIGNNPAATGEFLDVRAADPGLVSTSMSLTEVERDSLFYEKAFSYIRDNPQAWLQLAARKFIYFWWFRPSVGSSYLDAGEVFQAGKVAMALGYAPVLALALFGLLFLKRERALISLVAFIALPYMSTSVLYFAATRHRSPVEPFLLVLASLAIVGSVRWAGSAGGLLKIRILWPFKIGNGASP